MRLSNGFKADKEKTFWRIKILQRCVMCLQNEDGTLSTQLKKRIYDLKCSLHGELSSCLYQVPLREFLQCSRGVYNLHYMVSLKTHTGRCGLVCKGRGY